MSAADRRFFHYVSSFPLGREACLEAGLPDVSDDVHEMEMAAAFEVYTVLATQGGLIGVLQTAANWYAQMMLDDDDAAEFVEAVTVGISQAAVGAVALALKKGLIHVV